MKNAALLDVVAPKRCPGLHRTCCANGTDHADVCWCGPNSQVAKGGDSFQGGMYGAHGSVDPSGLMQLQVG